MNNPIAELWAELRSASRQHLQVRAVILLGAILVGVAFLLAQVGSPVVWSVQLLLAALVVLQPHTLMPFLYLLWNIGAWWAGTEQTWHYALLPAALGLLLVHTGCALAAAVPAQATLPESITRLWLGRIALVAAGTTAVWGAAGVLATTGRASGVIPGILGLAALAAGLAYFVWNRIQEQTES